MGRCWRCGRATTPGAPMYVFGPICNRADCKHVRQAISPRFKMFWFTVSLPDGEFLGRPGSFDMNGNLNSLSGMYGMSSRRRKEADKQAASGGER